MSALNFKVVEKDIGLIEWDDKNSSTNVLSISLLDEFSGLLEKIKAENLKALVLVSKKESVFIAGADINDIQNITEKSGFRNVLEKAHKILNEFESLPVSKIAAINGACLGGGLEMALAFDYRLASDSPKVKIGLPEIQLGIIPGFGGCIRLPRLVGLKTALSIILPGKSYPGIVAYKKGLVHELVPHAILNDRALELARQIVQGKKPAHPSQKYKQNKLLKPIKKQFMCLMARIQTAKQTKGFYPAPLKALSVIYKTYGSSNLKKSLEIETETFCDLAVTKTSKNLIKLFFNMQEIKKKQITPDASNIKNIGVLGAGIMGAGIAYACADKNYIVRLKDIDPKMLSKGLKSSYKLWGKQYKSRRIDKYQLARRQALLSGSIDYSGFHNLDVVIEAVSETPSIKEKVIAETAKHLNPKTIFASNTSSLSISELAKSYPHPENFVGMHFFNPVYKMPLVEVVKTEQSSPEALSTVFELAKKLGKTPILVKDSTGFVVNRMLMPYLTEALWLLSESQDIRSVDHEYCKVFGMPMGPFRLMDEVGLDICSHVISTFQKNHPDITIPKGAENLTQVLGLGKKQNKGFYIYDGKGQLMNKEVSAFYQTKTACSDKDVVKRGIYRMINEGHKIMEEQIVETEKDIDIGMILGTGFPPFLGGPMTYARDIGLKAIKEDLERFQKEHGQRFAPSPRLSD